MVPVRVSEERRHHNVVDKRRAEHGVVIDYAKVDGGLEQRNEPAAGPGDQQGIGVGVGERL